MTGYCVYVNNYPFINNKGKLHLCCKNNHHDISGNIKTHTLKDLYFSAKMNQVRNLLESGGEPEGCNICFDQERLGQNSFRIRNLNKLKKDNIPYDDTKIRALDLRLGSTCNLVCSMCHPCDSSKWQKIYGDFAKQVHDKSEKHIEFITSTNSPNLLNWAEYDQSWENIFCSIDDSLKQVYFAGGEPFYIKKFPQYLTIMQEKAPGASLHINTNATRFISDEHMKTVSKNINVRISIDGYEKSEEYQRAGTVWEEKVEVIKQYNSLFNIEAFDITLTSLTVRSAPKLIEFLKTNHPQVEILLRPVVNRQAQDIRSLPLELRKNTCEELIDISKKYDGLRNINQIIDFLTQPKIEADETFRKLIKYWDNYTGIQLEEFDKELARWTDENSSS